MSYKLIFLGILWLILGVGSLVSLFITSRILSGPPFNFQLLLPSHIVFIIIWLLMIIIGISFLRSHIPSKWIVIPVSVILLLYVAFILLRKILFDLGLVNWGFFGTFSLLDLLGFRMISEILNLLSGSSLQMAFYLNVILLPFMGIYSLWSVMSKPQYKK